MIIKNFFINLSFILLIFLLDRISKTYLIYLDKKLLGSEIFSSKYLNISLIWNEGIAFGLLSFNHENLYNLLTILIAVIILVICFMIYKSSGIKKYFLIFRSELSLCNLSSKSKWRIKFYSYNEISTVFRGTEKSLIIQ